MEHPVKEIPHIIHLLCEGSPVEQQKTLDTYFTQSASFVHPICRVPSFSHFALPLFGEANSRWVICMIYRWYKILSPEIQVTVHSAVLDQKTLTLYLSISQVFNLFFYPKWLWKPEVNLVTVLKLTHDVESNKYLIKDQQDLYQSNEFVKFMAPVLNLFVIFLQFFSTFLCILGAVFLAPITMFEQKMATKKVAEKTKK